MDLVALALYDVVLYCDDSGSMAFEEGVSLPYTTYTAKITAIKMFLLLRCQKCLSAPTVVEHYQQDTGIGSLKPSRAVALSGSS